MMPRGPEDPRTRGPEDPSDQIASVSSLPPASAGGIDQPVSVQYSRLANSNLISGVSYSGGGHLSQNAYDDAGRLEATEWGPPSGAVSRHDYELDAIGRRTGVLREDGTRWGWDYNTRGEVTGGAKLDAGGVLEPGVGFGYAYDAIGNRTASTLDKINGSGTHGTTYTANHLNQYTARANPGVAVARGAAHPEAEVVVNAPPPLTRDGVSARWAWEQAVDNSGGPVWQAANVSASRAGVGKDGATVVTAREGAVYVPPAAEVIAHDEDGNLTSDGRWVCAWDGENRLRSQETSPALVAAGAPRQRLEFNYDGGGRRIGKVVRLWDAATGAFVVQSQAVFLYDGWNLIAEFETNQQSGIRNLKSSYEWGLDVSGTMTGAGGVGGLLVIRQYPEVKSPVVTRTRVYAPSYDGNGNVTALVDLLTGQPAARYDYGPFGERVMVEGTAIAEANPFRFSTKYEDAESGWLYYGYRYYDPVAGRWTARDPIEEKGGVNLNRMLGNNAVLMTDILGLAAGDSDTWEKTLAAYDTTWVDEAVGMSFPKLEAICDGEGKISANSTTDDRSFDSDYNLSSSWGDTNEIEDGRALEIELTAKVSGEEYSFWGTVGGAVGGAGLGIGTVASVSGGTAAAGPPGWIAAGIGGAIGGVGGAFTTTSAVTATYTHKLKAKCKCENDTWKPKFSTIHENNEPGGDLEWRPQ